MNYKKTDFIKIEGNSYDIGIELGKEMKKEMQVFAMCFEKLSSTHQQKIIRLDKLLKARYPQIEQKVKGRADGAGVKYLDLLTAFTNCNEIERCTSIMVKTKNNMILGHNEDDDVNKDNFRFIHLIDKEAGYECKEILYVDSLSCGAVTVRKDFVLTMNYIWFDKEKINNNYLPWQLYTSLLCTAKDIDEFWDVIKNHHISTAISLNVYDCKSNKLYNIEKVLDKNSIKEINGINIHANHLLDERFVQYTPKYIDIRKCNTFNRQMVAERLIGDRKDLTEKEVTEILTYYGTCDYNSVMSKRNSGYECLTFCTFIFNIKNKTLKGYVHNKANDIVDFSL